MKEQTHDVLTAKEAAEFLRISEWTLRELANQGEVPGKRVGGQWRFLRTRLIEYLEKG